MKKANISIFVSHRGCPFACSFCNQREINGEDGRITGRDVERIVQAALPTLGDRRAEIAFFGGSFTGIPIEEQEELLESAYEFVKRGEVDGIRLSTRPDYIDEEVLKRCKDYGVTAIELGAQSLDDEVLRLAGRGHTAGDVMRAAEMIRAENIELGLQMMTGLLGDTPQKARKTAEGCIALKPATVRIYPCLVMEHTSLAEAHRAGNYTPQTLEEAVELVADLALMFHRANIRIIRMGLQPSKNLEESLIAGPYHPAFGELVKSRLIYRQMVAYLRTEQPQEVVIRVSDKLRSRLVGQKNENIKKLEEEFHLPIRIVRDNHGTMMIGD